MSIRDCAKIRRNVAVSGDIATRPRTIAIRPPVGVGADAPSAERRAAMAWSGPACAKIRPFVAVSTDIAAVMRSTATPPRVGVDRVVPAAAERRVGTGRSVRDCATTPRCVAVNTDIATRQPNIAMLLPATAVPTMRAPATRP